MHPTRSSVVFTLDSDITSIILSSNMYLERLEESLCKSGATVIIPSEVMIEVFSGGDEHAVSDRFSRLSHLIAKFEHQVRIGRLPHESIRAEAQALGSMRATPVTPLRQIRRSYLSNPERFGEVYKRVVEESRVFRERRLRRQGADKKVRYISLQQYDQSEIRELLKSYNQNTPFNHLDIIRQDIESFISIKKLTKRLNTAGFQITSAFTHFLLLRYLLILCAKPDEILVGMNKIDKNNWNDGAIASMAAYGSFFTTQDQNLTKVVAFLFEKKVIQFRPLCFEELWSELNNLI